MLTINISEAATSQAQFPHVWISDEQAGEIVTARFAYETILEALAVHARGDFVQPPKSHLWPQGPENEYERGCLITMPAYVGGEFQTLGAKLVASFPSNITRGLPRASGAIMLFDPSTGVPVAIIDCKTISARGAAAMASVCVDHLAAKSSQRIAVLGAGPIAHETVISLLVTKSRPIDSIRIFDPVGDRAASVVACVSQFTEVPIEHATSVEQCVRRANVIVAATSGATAYVQPEWVGGAWLIIALSADDFLPETIRSAHKVIFDDRRQSYQDDMLLDRLISAGELSLDRLHKDLPQIVVGAAPGREGDERIFVHPTGMAMHDLALAARVFKARNAAAAYARQTVRAGPACGGSDSLCVG